MDFHMTVYLLLGVACCVNGADKQMKSGDVSVQILGQSGKMKLWRDSSSQTDSKPITIFLDSLTEVDLAGNAVGASGNVKHSFNTFASQDFTFSAITEGSLPNTSIAASFVNFESQLSGLNSIVKMTIYIVKADGEFILGNDTIKVKKDEVKFSVELSNWSWCGCSQGQTSEVGAFVDVELTVQLHGSQKVEEDTAGAGKGVKKFGFGGGQSMDTPKTISIDGVYTEFPTGYPKFELKGSKNSFTFRFAKFTNKALYDPTVNTGGDSGATSTLASVLTITATILTALLFM